MDATSESRDEEYDVCADGYPEHDWEPGDIECRRCQADLSEWNEPLDDRMSGPDDGRPHPDGA